MWLSMLLTALREQSQLLQQEVSPESDFQADIFEMEDTFFIDIGMDLSAMTPTETGNFK